MRLPFLTLLNSQLIVSIFIHHMIIRNKIISKTENFSLLIDYCPLHGIFSQGKPKYGKDKIKKSCEQTFPKNLYGSFYSHLWSLVFDRNWISSCAAQKTKFSIIDTFSKCDQIRSYLRIWSHSLNKSLMENFIFCAVPLNLQISYNIHSWVAETIFPRVLTTLKIPKHIKNPLGRYQEPGICIRGFKSK